jgi:hypothetical protein
MNMKFFKTKEAKQELNKLEIQRKLQSRFPELLTLTVEEYDKILQDLNELYSGSYYRLYNYQDGENTITIRKKPIYTDEPFIDGVRGPKLIEHVWDVNSWRGLSNIRFEVKTAQEALDYFTKRV